TLLPGWAFPMRKSFWRSLLLSVAALAGTSLFASVRVGGPVAPDGKTEVTCDLPADQRIKNVGSRVDGAGMCVASSWEMAMRYQGLDALRGFRDWCARFPGGGYPAKLDKQIQQFCREKGLAAPGYVQYEGRDAALLREALAGGR